MASSLRPAARRIALASARLGRSPRCCLYSTSSSSPAGGELGVGELQGAKFRIEPLRRTGEDDNTKRARLLCALCSPLRSPGARRGVGEPCAIPPPPGLEDGC